MATEPISVLILGAGGDLTKRLLLPGLASLLEKHDFDVHVIGAGVDEHSADEWREIVRGSFAQVKDPDIAERYLASTQYITADATDPEQMKKLLEACDGTPVIYFALPPAVTVKVCQALAKLDLPDGTRLALEKPFGTDRASAHRLNQALLHIVPEQQIYRIDHFLGMSMVLNIVGLRFANQFLEPVWHNGLVERVEIVYDETLGLEGRGGYYDNAGALIDMIQSHLLEVLAIVAMDAPPRMDEIEMRSNSAQLLRNTRLWDDDPKVASKRARYSAGKVGDRELPAYKDEKGVDPSKKTETLAQVTVEVNTPRWRGVPFVLRSGKALGKYRTEVRVTMKPVDPIPGMAGIPAADEVIMDLKTGTVNLLLTMNGSGDPFKLEQTALEAAKEPGDLLPYGQVLRGILSGDPLLSVRGDIAEECWRIVEPVIAAWKADDVPLEEYPAGSKGPEGW